MYHRYRNIFMTYHSFLFFPFLVLRPKAKYGSEMMQWKCYWSWKIAPSYLCSQSLCQSVQHLGFLQSGKARHQKPQLQTRKAEGGISLYQMIPKVAAVSHQSDLVPWCTKEFRNLDVRLERSVQDEIRRQMSNSMRRETYGNGVVGSISVRIGVVDGGGRPAGKP